MMMMIKVLHVLCWYSMLNVEVLIMVV
jgi:hypothetical protein